MCGRSAFKESDVPAGACKWQCQCVSQSRGAVFHSKVNMRNPKCFVWYNVLWPLHASTRRFLDDDPGQITRPRDHLIDHPAFATSPMHTDHCRGHVRMHGAPSSIRREDVAFVCDCKINKARCIVFGKFIGGCGSVPQTSRAALLIRNFIFVAHGVCVTMSVMRRHLCWTRCLLCRGVWPDRDPFGNVVCQEKKD